MQYAAESWEDDMTHSTISKNSRLVCFAAAFLGISMFALANASFLVLCAYVLCCCGDQHTLEVDTNVQHELNNTCIYNVSYLLNSKCHQITTHGVIFKTHLKNTI